MKQIVVTAARIMLVMVLYVCCSSVVCCGSKPVTTDVTTYDNGNSRGDSNKTTDEDISPNQLISIRLTEFL